MTTDHTEHSHSDHAHSEHGHSEHGHGEHDSGPDWHDEEFVAGWLERQQEREPERHRQFALIRAVIPKQPTDEFRYLNLGSGPGNLDEVLLDHFTQASATLVDYSLAMLDAARTRLARFGNRVEYVQADFGDADWAGALGGTFDFVVSTLAVHHAEEPRRIRELYAEAYRLLGHGGALFNLDYMRPARPSFAPLGAWAARDPEAGLGTRGHDGDTPGSLLEHLSWLSEAGFTGVDVLWKDLQTALLCGVRDHIHVPDTGDSHGHGHEHAHGEGHAH